MSFNEALRRLMAQSGVDVIGVLAADVLQYAQHRSFYDVDADRIDDPGLEVKPPASNQKTETLLLRAASSLPPSTATGAYFVGLNHNFQPFGSKLAQPLVAIARCLRVDPDILGESRGGYS